MCADASADSHGVFSGLPSFPSGQMTPDGGHLCLNSVYLPEILDGVISPHPRDGAEFLHLVPQRQQPEPLHLETPPDNTTQTVGVQIVSDLWRQLDG